ncbi:6,7-dimethyl-8-ribityllumazine synthase [Flagellatimonas centrodinii]|uniref:6,7-dimethyl-8-ribityllumazine synthase n=1 Tax=Flagellatimonas centrodinii TaxID=2806210 RepID=UPI001FEE1DEB|nr:6,7-dimethyl-8-ribityllumazine synthase [Flagellatimonas centrodinii]ULQ46193.1 6,7-dimethyl-8-ribityllumazine synthase [Flagellatimonas centrodinii]
MQKSGYEAPEVPNAGELEDVIVAIVATRWNTEIVEALIDGARECLLDWGVLADNIIEHRVPGAFEIPLAVSMLAEQDDVDAVVAVGAVIRGDTPHFDFVAGECARGLMTVQLREQLPIGFGVLTVNTVEQAEERAGPGADNKGYEAAAAALEMLRLSRELL